MSSTSSTVPSSKTFSSTAATFSSSLTTNAPTSSVASPVRSISNPSPSVKASSEADLASSDFEKCSTSGSSRPPGGGQGTSGGGGPSSGSSNWRTTLGNFASSSRSAAERASCLPSSSVNNETPAELPEALRRFTTCCDASPAVRRTNVSQDRTLKAAMVMSVVNTTRNQASKTGMIPGTWSFILSKTASTVLGVGKPQTTRPSMIMLCLMMQPRTAGFKNRIQATETSEMR
mmetsp:Transcript_2369/g.7849  ORF Transcript_2369/g.7849 Transcript_2369/m.7849 type:complete len:232 (-) Transcript_2369:3502-4197(-)